MAHWSQSPELKKEVIDKIKKGQDRNIEFSKNRHKNFGIYSINRKVSRICANCNNNYICKPSSNKYFCNKDCRSIFFRNNKIKKPTREESRIIRKSYGWWKNPEKLRKTMSESQIKHYNGDPTKHPLYIDGRSYEPYPIEFNNNLRIRIKTRDKYRCQLCYKSPQNKLGLHHINYNKQDCREENLITLCNSCNSKANGFRDYWQYYFERVHNKAEVL